MKKKKKKKPKRVPKVAWPSTRSARLRELTTLRQAKELGGVDIQACSLSMDLLHLE